MQPSTLENPPISSAEKKVATEQREKEQPAEWWAVELSHTFELGDEEVESLLQAPSGKYEPDRFIDAATVRQALERANYDPAKIESLFGGVAAEQTVEALRDLPGYVNDHAGTPEVTEANLERLLQGQSRADLEKFMASPEFQSHPNKTERLAYWLHEERLKNQFEIDEFEQKGGLGSEEKRKAYEAWDWSRAEELAGAYEAKQVAEPKAETEKPAPAEPAAVPAPEATPTAVSGTPEQPEQPVPTPITEPPSVPKPEAQPAPESKKAVETKEAPDATQGIRLLLNKAKLRQHQAEVAGALGAAPGPVDAAALDRIAGNYRRTEMSPELKQSLDALITTVVKNDAIDPKTTKLKPAFVATLNAMRQQTGLSEDAIKGIVENQQKYLQERGRQLVNAKEGGFLKRAGKAIAKAAGYTATGAAIFLSTGGVGGFALLGGASLAALRTLNVARADKRKENRISASVEELKTIIAKEPKEGKPENDERKAMLDALEAQVATKIQEMIDGLGRSEKPVDDKKEAVVKEINPALRRRDDIRLARKYLEEQYPDMPIEQRTQLLKQVYVLAATDESNERAQQAVEASGRQSVRSLMQKLDKQFAKIQGGETKEQQVITTGVFVGAGMLARHMPVFQRIFGAYTGVKAGEGLAWAIGANTNDKRRTAKDFEKASFQREEMDTLLAEVRAQLDDKQFREQFPQEYDELRVKADALEEERIRLVTKEETEGRETWRVAQKKQATEVAAAQDEKRAVWADAAERENLIPTEQTAINKQLEELEAREKTLKEKPVQRLSTASAFIAAREARDIAALKKRVGKTAFKRGVTNALRLLGGITGAVVGPELMRDATDWIKEKWQGGTSVPVEEAEPIGPPVDEPVTEQPPVVTPPAAEQPVVETGSGLKNEHYKVDRTWMHNDSPSPQEADLNEERLHFGGERGTGFDKDGNVVFTVDGMEKGGSFNTAAGKNLDVPELKEAGKLVMLLTPTEGGEAIEVPIGKDGTVMIAKDDPLYQWFEKNNGQASFKGRYLEVARVEDMSPDAAPDAPRGADIIATVKGSNELKVEEVQELLERPATGAVEGLAEEPSTENVEEQPKDQAAGGEQLPAETETAASSSEPTVEDGTENVVTGGEKQPEAVVKEQILETHFEQNGIADPNDKADVMKLANETGIDVGDVADNYRYIDRDVFDQEMKEEVLRVLAGGIKPEDALKNVDIELTGITDIKTGTVDNVIFKYGPDKYVTLLEDRAVLTDHDNSAANGIVKSLDGVTPRQLIEGLKHPEAFFGIEEPAAAPTIPEPLATMPASGTIGNYTETVPLGSEIKPGIAENIPENIKVSASGVSTPNNAQENVPNPYASMEPTSETPAAEMAAAGVGTGQPVEIKVGQAEAGTDVNAEPAVETPAYQPLKSNPFVNTLDVEPRLPSNAATVGEAAETVVAPEADIDEAITIPAPEDPLTLTAENAARISEQYGVVLPFEKNEQLVMTEATDVPVGEKPSITYATLLKTVEGKEYQITGFQRGKDFADEQQLFDKVREFLMREHELSKVLGRDAAVFLMDSGLEPDELEAAEFFASHAITDPAEARQLLDEARELGGGILRPDNLKKAYESHGKMAAAA